MAAQPKLVNKQFNSPIGLYSEQNVREVLHREQQMLANGAIGIDFHNSQVGKPANLQNSAVLRMLEEEESRRGGRPGNDDYYPRPLRDVSWPPPNYDQQSQLRSSFKDVIIPGAKRVAWPPPQEGVLDPSEVQQHNAVQAQGGPQYPTHQNSYPSHQAVPQQQPAQQSHRPLKPLDVSSVGTASPLASPAHNQVPQGYRPVTPSGGKSWAPVHSPATTPLGSGAQQYFGASPQGYSSQPQYQPVAQPYQATAGPQYQPSLQQYQQPAQQYQPPSQQYQQPAQQYQQPAQQPSYSPQPYQSSPQQFQPQPAHNQYQASQPVVAQNQVAAPRPQSARPVEPPPSTITLRPSAPVSQSPAPVFATQPATASFRVVVGGKHLRGDLKWPPEDVKHRMDEENKQRVELARGPACRPLRKDKDYMPFFQQHALNSTYPGYKIPPGTQYYRPE